MRVKMLRERLFFSLFMAGEITPVSFSSPPIIFVRCEKAHTDCLFIRGVVNFPGRFDGNAGRDAQIPIVKITSAMLWQSLATADVLHSGVQ